MKSRNGLIGIGLMGAAVVLAVLQWFATVQGSALPSFVEFAQTWVIITAAAAWVVYMAASKSNSIKAFVRNVFISHDSLPISATILAYLSGTWFSGFYEKYNVAAWHSGLALKGFWLGTIAQSHPSATNPFPNVHYSFWVNLLQWNVDHTVYSWFGYVVIGSELFIAGAFIATALAVFYRPMALVAIAGALAGLLFHLFFLMSGSAGVNALMPYLTAIAAIALVAGAVAGPTDEEATELPTLKSDVVIDDLVVVAANGKTPSTARTTVPSR